MKTECVLCTSARFTEHLSADPRELSSVCSGREDEGGRGSEDHCLQAQWREWKGFAAVFAAAPLVSMETDTDLHLSLELFWSMAAAEQAGRGQERGMRGKDRGGNSGE